MANPADKIYAVTGATGHLGVNLVLELLSRGHSVRALHHRRNIPELLKGRERLSLDAIDILEPVGLTRAVSGVDGVFHLAGKISIAGDRDGSLWRCNVEGTKNVATACLTAGVERLVHCSSVHALKVDPNTHTLTEDLELADEQGRRPAYDRSKAAGMREVERFRNEGLSVVSVLPSGVIGPHDLAPSRMGRVFLTLREGGLPALTGGAFDFVDVRDVALGMMSAMEKDEPCPRYLLGGHYVTAVELFTRAAKHVGVVPPRFVAPLQLAKYAAPFSLAWARMRNQEPLFTPESIRTLSLGRPTDHSLAQRDLDYRPRPLSETIADLYASFEDPSMTLIDR